MKSKGQPRDRRKGTQWDRPPGGSTPGLPDQLAAPSATRLLSHAHLNACRNVGLLFDRYLHFQQGWQLGTYKVGKRDHSAKMFNIEEIVNAQERCNQDSAWQAMHWQFIDRWRTSVQALGAQPFPMSPDWCLIVGLGGKGALEVGFTFHRVYGFPIIPGGALKGLARAAALWEIAEALGVSALPLHKAKERAKEMEKTPLEKLEAVLVAYDKRVEDPKVQAKMREDEQKALQILEVLGIDLSVCQSQMAHFRTVFGTLHGAGQGIFFDGVPAQPPTLKPDVMNVHYAEYYQGDKPPADYLNPNPIPFLTVGKGSQFLFAVGWRGAKDNAAREQAIAWLKSGLSELGVGAKTAAGYGYMVEVG